ncbi:MAG: ATP-binding protein [Chloroflexi bacterium]|nr:ATP-binding protein [Chloroflexota bacterium]
MNVALEVQERPTLFGDDRLQLVTHVGRDVLANAAHFATVPKAIYEYVSNSIDAAPAGRPCTVRVSIVTVGPRRRIEIADDAAGMSREQLRSFFTMHGENAWRRAGRKVRGRFGTGKIAAFGRADRLRVDTAQAGLRNVAELKRADLEAAQAGRPVHVHEIVVEEPTDAPDGTLVVVEDLQRGTRVDRTEIVRYLQRQLGRHLVRHRVAVEGERVEYAPPEATEEHRFPAPAEVEALAGPVELVVRVAARPLAEEENGVAVLSHGYLNAMTLAGIEGKPETQYLFGEIDIPVLDDDTAPVPAFMSTRDLTLNPWNPIVAALVPWMRASLETVRRELVRRAGERRRAAEQQELERLGTELSSLLANIYRGERSLSMNSDPLLRDETPPMAEIATPAPERPEARPRKARSDKGIPRGPRPPREASVEVPQPMTVTMPSLSGDRTSTTFRVAFRHAGESSPRAFYVAEERGIVVNLDHPEAVASLANGGPTSPFFAHYCMRTTLEEFTLVMVSELGYPDAPEIAREIRERSDRYSRTFAPAILRFAFADAEDATTATS